MLISGCATRNVQFYDKISNEKNLQGSINTPVEIHIDYLGSVYPKTGFPDTFKNKTSNTNNSLKRNMYAIKNPICDLEVSAEAKLSCDNETNWEEAQSKLWEARAQEILDRWEHSNREAEIVFLVHGFSVKAEHDDFDDIRIKLEAFDSTPDSTIFVDVNWDGFYSTLRLPAWNNAQYSGPLVGFNLRRLFNKMDDLQGGDGLPQKIRVITHSSGAFVIGATFGNSFAAFPQRLTDYPQNSGYKIFFENRSETSGDYRIPKVENLRVANFAAATPSNTYVYNGEKLPNSDYNENYGWLAENSTIGFSVTNDDWGLRKVFLRPESFGASTIGNNKKYYCDFMKEGLDEKEVKSFIFNFDRNKSNGSKRDHSILRYLVQPQAKPMLEMLFDKDMSNPNYLLECGS